MFTNTVTGIAHPNIAFFEYWGNRNNTLRLSSNSSISINLDSLYTRITVSFYLSYTFLVLIYKQR
jgi:mevalonate pyrophosphate decarboxylase